MTEQKPPFFQDKTYDSKVILKKHAALGEDGTKPGNKAELGRAKNYLGWVPVQPVRNGTEQRGVGVKLRGESVFHRPSTRGPGRGSFLYPPQVTKDSVRANCSLRLSPFSSYGSFSLGLKERFAVSPFTFVHKSSWGITEGKIGPNTKRCVFPWCSVPGPPIRSVVTPSSVLWSEWMQPSRLSGAGLRILILF